MRRWPSSYPVIRARQPLAAPKYLGAPIGVPIATAAAASPDRPKHRLRAYPKRFRKFPCRPSSSRNVSDLSGNHCVPNLFWFHCSVVVDREACVVPAAFRGVHVVIGYRAELATCDSHARPTRTPGRTGHRAFKLSGSAVGCHLPTLACCVGYQPVNLMDACCVCHARTIPQRSATSSDKIRLKLD